MKTERKLNSKNNVYAKKITVASNDVVFEEKLDMALYNQDNRRNRTNLIYTGNLEFTNRGKVKFNKDYASTITTSKANIGEVTFVNTPNIYEVSAVNKRIEKLTFTGNHVRNLRKNIYATQVNFDAGTYNVHANPITIYGNSKINGSTFDLRRDLILNDDVEFSGNITFNVTGGYSVFFQNNLPSVITGTNIIINVNGAHPADAVSALSIFRVNGGAFIPEGHNYNPATGTINFRNGLQVQQAGQAAAQEVGAQQQARVNAQTQEVQAQARQVQVQALQQQQTQAQVQAFTQQRAAEQQVQNAHAQVLAQELVQGQARAVQAQQQQGSGRSATSSNTAEPARSKGTKLNKISSKQHRLKLSVKLTKELSSKDYKRNAKKMLEESSKDCKRSVKKMLEENSKNYKQNVKKMLE